MGKEGVWGFDNMLAHTLHLQLLSVDESNATVLNDLKDKSVDGDLVGVVGNSWVLNPSPISISWHSIRGVNEDSYTKIISALCKDVREKSQILA